MPITRLATRNGVNKVSLLVPSRPGDTLIPFRDPATVQGICFFDVSKGPVRVKTRVEEGALLTLSFRLPKGGKVFYSMTDRAAFRDTIDIRLVTPSAATDDRGQRGYRPRRGGAERAPAQGAGDAWADGGDGADHAAERAAGRHAAHRGDHVCPRARCP